MKLSNTKDNRLEVIRIIAIFMVVISHVANRYLYSTSNLSAISSILLMFANSVLRVAVPLFFMISGIVNIPKKFDTKKYFSRIIRMVVILAIWTLVYYYIYDFDTTYLLRSMFTYIKNHLWYMYALIGLSIASPFISKMVMNLDEFGEKLFVYLWLFFSGFCYLFKTIIAQVYHIRTSIDQPVPIFGAAYYLGYYVVGYLIYKNFDKIIAKLNMVLLSLIALLSCFSNGLLTIFASFKKNGYYKHFFNYSNILVILPSLVFIIICLSVIKDKEYKIVKIICPYIFGIYLSHIIILDKLIEYLKISDLILGFFVYTVLTCILSYFLIFIIKKIPYINKYIC